MQLVRGSSGSVGACSSRQQQQLRRRRATAAAARPVVAATAAAAPPAAASAVMPTTSGRSSSSSGSSGLAAAWKAIRGSPRSAVVARAGRGSSTGEKWWEKNAPNMASVNGVQELVDALADAGDDLVIVDFYAPWCGACRSLHPKLVKLMEQFPDVRFLKLDFDENKDVAKALGVRVLPYFHVYHGAEGRVAAFSCTVSKFGRMREALEQYHTPICSLEPTPGLPEFPSVVAHCATELTRLRRVAGTPVAAAEARLSAGGGDVAGGGANGAAVAAPTSAMAFAAAAAPAEGA